MHNHAFSTIKVTGKGVLRLRPDTTRVSITLNGRHKDYSETVRRSTEDSEKLKDVLEKLGFKRTELKTLNFRVDPRYESYRENDEYKQRLAGYEFYHGMKLEFLSDSALLGRVLYALATSGLDPEFSLSYTVRDTEGAKNQLLSAAVADARAKAEVLCAAAGNTLGDIMHINYSMDEPDFGHWRKRCCAPTWRPTAPRNLLIWISNRTTSKSATRLRSSGLHGKTGTAKYIDRNGGKRELTACRI